jgi:transcriptional regulator with XRE-family HTH domain
MAVIDVISANLPILRELRDRIGQLDLAERVGVSRRTIARLENAEVTDPGVDLMRRIGRELGVSLALLTEHEVEAVTIPLPKDVSARLRSDEALGVLDAMVQAARHSRRP